MKIRSLATTRVAALLLEGGPQTAAALSRQLGMTSTAVRKHLDALESAGLINSHEQAPFGPKSPRPRGRGRPARVFAVTQAGREYFEQPYDQLAVDAVHFIEANFGADAVRTFARSRVDAVMAGSIESNSPISVEQLAQAMADQGFSASVRPAPMGDAVQLCQHNCPISHVASEFPQFCEAETEAIGAALGVHVTRISTIASGSAICTTHIPLNTRRDA